MSEPEPNLALQLCRAAATNNLELARSLLALPAVDPNGGALWRVSDTPAPFSPPVTPGIVEDVHYHALPLHLATLAGHVEMVALLVDAGADPNEMDGRERSALLCAIYGLDTLRATQATLDYLTLEHPSHLIILRDHLLCHPRLNSRSLHAPQDAVLGLTLACLAAYLDKAAMLKLLLTVGRVEPDGRDWNDATALMYAARDGHLQVCQLLLSHGASPLLTDRSGWSAFRHGQDFPLIIEAFQKATSSKNTNGKATPFLNDRTLQGETNSGEEAVSPTSSLSLPPLSPTRPTAIIPTSPTSNTQQYEKTLQEGQCDDGDEEESYHAIPMSTPLETTFPEYVTKDASQTLPADDLLPYDDPQQGIRALHEESIGVEGNPVRETGPPGSIRTYSSCPDRYGTASIPPEDVELASLEMALEVAQANLKELNTDISEASQGLSTLESFMIQAKTEDQRAELRKAKKDQEDWVKSLRIEYEESLAEVKKKARAIRALAPQRPLERLLERLILPTPTNAEFPSDLYDFSHDENEGGEDDTDESEDMDQEVKKPEGNQDLIMGQNDPDIPPSGGPRISILGESMTPQDEDEEEEEEEEEEDDDDDTPVYTPPGGTHRGFDDVVVHESLEGKVGDLEQHRSSFITTFTTHSSSLNQSAHPNDPSSTAMITKRNQEVDGGSWPGSEQEGSMAHWPSNLLNHQGQGEDKDGSSTPTSIPSSGRIASVHHREGSLGEEEEEGEGVQGLRRRVEYLEGERRDLREQVSELQSIREALLGAATSEAETLHEEAERLETELGGVRRRLTGISRDRAEETVRAEVLGRPWVLSLPDGREVKIGSELEEDSGLGVSNGQGTPHGEAQGLEGPLDPGVRIHSSSQARPPWANHELVESEEEMEDRAGHQRILQALSRAHRQREQLIEHLQLIAKERMALEKKNARLVRVVLEQVKEKLLRDEEGGEVREAVDVIFGGEEESVMGDGKAQGLGREKNVNEGSGRALGRGEREEMGETEGEEAHESQGLRSGMARSSSPSSSHVEEDHGMESRNSLSGRVGEGRTGIQETLKGRSMTIGPSLRKYQSHHQLRPPSSSPTLSPSSPRGGNSRSPSPSRIARPRQVSAGIGPKTVVRSIDTGGSEVKEVPVSVSQSLRGSREGKGSRIGLGLGLGPGSGPGIRGRSISHGGDPGTIPSSERGGSLSRESETDDGMGDEKGLITRRTRSSTMLPQIRPAGEGASSGSGSGHGKGSHGSWGSTSSSGSTLVASDEVQSGPIHGKRRLGIGSREGGQPNLSGLNPSIMRLGQGGGGGGGGGGSRIPPPSRLTKGPASSSPGHQGDPRIKDHTEGGKKEGKGKGEDEDEDEDEDSLSKYGYTAPLITKTGSVDPGMGSLPEDILSANAALAREMMNRSATPNTARFMSLNDPRAPSSFPTRSPMSPTPPPVPPLLGEHRLGGLGVRSNIAAIMSGEGPSLVPTPMSSILGRQPGVSITEVISPVHSTHGDIVEVGPDQEGRSGTGSGGNRPAQLDRRDSEGDTFGNPTSRHSQADLATFPHTPKDLSSPDEREEREAEMDDVEAMERPSTARDDWMMGEGSGIRGRTGIPQSVPHLGASTPPPRMRGLTQPSLKTGMMGGGGGGLKESPMSSQILQRAKLLAQRNSGISETLAEVSKLRAEIGLLDRAIGQGKGAGEARTRSGTLPLMPARSRVILTRKQEEYEAKMQILTEMCSRTS